MILHQIESGELGGTYSERTIRRWPSGSGRDTAPFAAVDRDDRALVGGFAVSRRENEEEGYQNEGTLRMASDAPFKMERSLLGAARTFSSVCQAQPRKATSAEDLGSTGWQCFSRIRRVFRRKYRFSSRVRSSPPRKASRSIFLRKSISSGAFKRGESPLKSTARASTVGAKTSLRHAGEGASDQEGCE